VEWVDYPVCSIHHEEREEHEEISKNESLESRSSGRFVFFASFVVSIILAHRLWLTSRSR
jgi:hypothetical protein